LRNRTFNKLISFITISNFERRAAFALLFVFLAISAFIQNRTSALGSAIDENKLALFEVQIAENIRAKDSITKLKNASSELTFFNPNSDSYVTLMDKGIYSSLAKNIINYRDKGGRFKRKSDLKKLYKINEKVYRELFPFIVISRLEEGVEEKDEGSVEEVSKENSYNNSKKKFSKSLELNTASAEELKSLKGIGEVLSSRIVKYRDLLGGFFEIKQMLEVYGVDSSFLVLNKNKLVLDHQKIVKINLNTIGEKELARHPYVGYKLAKQLCVYRQQHGNYSGIQDLKNVHYLKGKKLNRILPYLDLK
jgi:competence protein ComEA